MDPPIHRSHGSEFGYALEEMHLRSGPDCSGGSVNSGHKYKQKPRRREMGVPERRFGLECNDTTDDSGSISEDDIDEHVQLHHFPPKATASNYHGFIRASRILEKRLDQLAHTVQQLGSALVLSRACHEVQSELCKVRKYFQNTASRFLGVLVDNINQRKRQRRMRRRNRPRGRRDLLQTSVEEPNQNEISEALDRLYVAMEGFLIAIRDFEDYTDRDGEQSLENFMDQVGILSGCLSYFGADGDSDEFPRFIYEKTVAMKRHLEHMDEALARFVEIGVPCISFAQKRSWKMLFNAATVATFFAGVAATALQFSIESNITRVQIAANTLWFASLILSIGSAINGLMAMTWRQAVFSSPKRQQHWLVRFWTRHGYLVLLVLSVLSFLGGLLCYMYETQHPLAFWTAVACIAFCAIGLVDVSIWFGIERWSFTRSRKAMHSSASDEDSEEASASRDLWDYARVQWFRLRSIFAPSDAQFGRSESLPTSTQESQSVQESLPEPMCSTLNRLRDVLRCIGNFPCKIREYMTPERGPNDAETVEDMVVCVRTSRQALAQRSQSDALARAMMHDTINPKHLEDFVGNIKEIRLRHSGLQHNGERVKHMRFSPCGKLLAVCYQFTCIIYRVGTRIEYHQQLRHTRRSAKQVEWSPDGKLLLTRLKDRVRYWVMGENNEFSAKDTIKLQRSLKWICWIDNDEFLALAEDSYVQKVSLSSSKIFLRELPRDLTFHEIYPLGKEDIVLFIATHDFDEDKETHIDCIIVYNLNMNSGDFSNQVQGSQRSFESMGMVHDNVLSGRIERKVPLLHDVESLTVCDDCEHIVVSYEESAPEIWKYQYTPPQEQSDEFGRHTIVRVTELVVPKEEAEICVDSEWGDALFMGPSNEIVVCPADDRVYMWNSHTKECIHSMPVGDGDEDDVPEFAWHVRDNALAMVSASGKSGSLKLWVAGDRRPPDDRFLKVPLPPIQTHDEKYAVSDDTHEEKQSDDNTQHLNQVQEAATDNAAHTLPFAYFS